ncbi:hypothetical protein BU24DRAFT_491241 [Aaosphaeria arxii CBS 175.79]|uniref:Fucose-specific lectin n=1 Tax=Aaosphaeria arxii CBS 175.79 TaxID=1450172 RepID=A0A6A5XZV2_9PLEO|nr:uncharacterized protein BU24DRAFT_491241 [Aaosphaeria arxii CBS 175.79]KAF2018241.1 hypothetical protein BU24DRAFT_491241 [Aaosphaeria arxii CBS 175.79]
MASPTPTPAYAEFQNSSPEVHMRAEPPPQAPPVVHKYEVGPDHDYNQPHYAQGYYGQEKGVEAQPPVQQSPPKKRFLGLSRGVIIAIVVGIILIIVGVVVGVVLGTRTKSSNNEGTKLPAETASSIVSSQTAQTARTAQATTSTPSSSSATTTSRTSSASSSATASVTILQAIYATNDVTEKARNSLQQGANLVVDMDDKGPWAEPDPWFGTNKCLSILHQAGTSIRTFVACEGDGVFTLVPERVGPFPNAQEITRQGPKDNNFAIASIVWGKTELREGDLYEKVWDLKKNNTAVPFTNDFFGIDTHFGNGKSGVIFYTQDDFKTFRSLIGKEDGSTSW